MTLEDAQNFPSVDQMLSIVEVHNCVHDQLSRDDFPFELN